ncbi:MAG TPA: hypothetical protein DIU14_00565, partial [Actinobacteria bacterium]|nr:hypothetical protein [Actinomycetota bacterium]
FTMNLTNAQDPTGQFDTWLEASLDGGTKWNGKSDGTGTPYRASCCVGTHYFPAIAVGDPGQVDMAWLRTKFVTPTTPNGKPLVNADANANWRVVMAQNVGTGGEPTWRYVTKGFVHYGDICTLRILPTRGIGPKPSGTSSISRSTRAASPTWCSPFRTPRPAV